ncbi:MAG: tRNA threonylcarbamoyladenosine dehydratase [Oscillospiraceae bacterium]|nr:tRNA threonylcarbamoyladenosine dehydratase [Oscillospiraceae bacterium]
MTEHQYERTQLLLGEEGVAALRRARVAVFGIGGVGGFAVEALARAGVGTLDLVDSDRVVLSNLNRQIIATHDTLGRYKTEAAAERIRSIDPETAVHIHNCFFLPETASQFDFTQYDYVIDAIDTVTGKLGLIEACRAAGTPIVCSMGAGNKLDPTAFRLADIYDTKVCPLARVMRYECRKRGIPSLPVVYSEEKPVLPREKGGPVGSVSFVPSVAGLILAGKVIRDLVAEKPLIRGRK